MTVFSPNLNIAHLDANSAQPEVPVDNAIDALDAAITGLKTFEVDDTNALALSQDDLASCFTVQLIPGSPIPTALIGVTVEAHPRGLFCVDNMTAKDCTVQITAQPGPVPYIKAGTSMWLRSDGVNVSEKLDPVFTVATLPVAGVAGRRAFVSNATAPVFAAAVVGAGGVTCPVYDTGIAWFAG